MSFLRRVLARGEGRGVLDGAPRHVFRREVEVPSAEVETPVVTPTTTPVPVHVSRAPEPVSGEVRSTRAPRVPVVDTRVERFEQVERQIVREPQTTIVHVNVPPAVPPAQAAVTTPSAPGETRRVLEHHHHHEHTHTELRETHHAVTERVVVRTTAPQAARPPLRRSVPTPASRPTPVVVAPAAPPLVHVSIGRIVLSAAPPPSKPERPRSPAAPARSLADILAAKKGRP